MSDTERICRNCAHWGEVIVAPWACLPAWSDKPTPRNERRELEMLDERECRRFGGFTSSGGYGRSQFQKDGSREPAIAYMLAPPPAHRCHLITTADFGCVQWEPIW